MAEAKAFKVEPTEKKLEVQISYGTYNEKPTMSLRCGMSNITFGQQKARNIVANIDAIRAFAERKN